jgi:acyl-homoserine-lactone acylase
MRRALVWGGGVAVVLLVAFVVLLRPTLLPSFDGTPYLQNGTKYDVRVLRDTFGVPHVYGKRDEDVAFGLAYAHAEDDFLTIQQSLMTSRGRLGLVDSQAPRLLNAATGAVGLGRWVDTAGGDPAITDYLVQLFRVRARIDGQMKSNLADGRISPKTYDMLAAYADGINLYAAQHPDRLVAGFSGVSADDIAAGFVFFTPFFFGIDRTVGELFGPERAHEISVPQGAGSNAMAVAPARAADGATRLLINSHQPYTGPLAWYEARVKSDEGWDMVGGIFPGTPFILHGFGPVLGWANTVNNPDLADVYVLTVNPDNPNQYRYDGAWRDFERSTAELQLRIVGPVAIRVTRDVLWSVYGPVLQRPHGTYALRYATMDKINQVEAYYRLNRASNMDAVMGALELQALPSFNFTYADRAGNIAYIYNAVFPKRDGAYDWQKYLPGDTSRTLWSGYEPFSAVPKIVNPNAGFVYNANNTPFTSTAVEEDLKPSAFAPSLGVDTRETNRGFRLQELLSADASITGEEFRAIKYDKRYSARSKLAVLIARLAAMDFSKEPDAAELQRAQALLKAYDLSADAESRSAALAIMVGLPVVVPTFQGKPEGDILAAMRGAIATLTKHHGRLDPKWGEVNRFRRGTIDAPADGGPDVLRDFESDIVPQADGKFEARKGDTLYYFVEWDKAGRVRAEGIHQFGSATLDETSPHYADQAAIFLREEVKPIWLDEAELRKNLKREYRPGR